MPLYHGPEEESVVEWPDDSKCGSSAMNQSFQEIKNYTDVKNRSENHPPHRQHLA
jgi:hypothetical protein